MVHELKILPKYFKRIIDNKKTFEIRKNDRDFQTGDEIILNEFDETGYTGRKINGEITYIFHGGEYGIDANYCIFSFKIYSIQGVKE